MQGSAECLDKNYLRVGTKNSKDRRFLRLVQPPEQRVGAFFFVQIVVVEASKANDSCT